MCNGTLFTIDRIFSWDGVNPSTTVLLGQCLTYGDTRAPSSDWKLWNYEKEGADEREILRGSDTYAYI